MAPLSVVRYQIKKRDSSHTIFVLTENKTRTNEYWVTVFASIVLQGVGIMGDGATGIQMG